MTKRVFTAFLAIAVLFAAAPLAFAAPAESRMLGDVNGNGKIDASDYAMCKRAYLNTYKLNESQFFRADINGNKKVDASEYAMIKRHYLGTYVIKQPETQHEHVFAGEWQYDAESHWQLCAADGERGNMAAHTFGDWTAEPAPTCTEPGTRTHSCTVCGYTETEPVEAPGHDWDEDGICTRCGKQRTNGVFRFKLNEDGNSYTLTGAILNHLIDTDIIIPSTYKGLPVTSIGERALCSHTYIKSVIIPDSVTSIGAEAFSCCDSLISVTIPGSVTDIGEKAFEWCDSLESIAVPGSVTSIGSYAFAYCPGLKRADFLNCAINIPDHAFIYCSSLESVTLGDSVTSINQYAFEECSSLKNINIPDSVTSIGNFAFLCCASLESISVPDSVTSIGSSAFRECTSLKSITVPDSVNTLGDDAFMYNTSLESATLGNGVTKINIGTFTGCTGLTSVIIPDGVTVIDSYAFNGCSSLTGVTIPENVTRIGYYAFEECTSLTGITIPDSVTVIEHHAFFSCTGLESITLGKGVKEIGNSAFYDCSSLETVYYTGTEEQWYAIKAGSYNELLKNATVVFNYKPEGEIHTVTTLKDESHILSVTGGGEYKSGQSVTVSAVPCETEYLDAELQIRLNVSEGLLSGGKVYYVNESLCADWASAINEYESSGLLAVGLYCATEFATGKYSAVVPYFDGTYSVIINGSKAHAALVNKSRIEYEFVKWVDPTDGSETAVSTDTDYTFVMPDHDVVLKAIGLYHLYSTDGETIIDKTGTVCCSAGNVYAA